MSLPVLTFNGTDYTAKSGLREVFWFGRSNCQATEGVNSFCFNDNWVTHQGWNQKLREYVLSHRASADTEDVTKELLWLYVPDFKKNGVMGSITEIADIGYDPESKSIEGVDDIFWRQNDECAGFVISDKNCEFRTKEMELITYTPIQCQTGEIVGCNDLVAYARYNN